MNANCYKIIFSKRLGSLVAVGEHTTSTGKAASGQACRGRVVADSFVGALRFSVASFALACLSLGNTQAQSSSVAVSATALPQGASINQGSAIISTQGAKMAITQATDKASINWNSFNIGSAASVNIAQPSTSSVLLNRVVGQDPSQILGKLSANGQVILLNPNGIVFGRDGSVTASSFTASTFNLTDADFMSGFYKYNRNGSTASVVNQGTIETTAGGFVALIGATVTNEGSIRTTQGDVVLAAAENVTLPSDLVKPQTPVSPNTVSVRMSKRVRLELDPAAVNTAVSNTESGVIVTEGGQVLLQSAALSSAVASVTHSGRIDTSAPQAGAVTVLADHGIIKVDGSIKANSSGDDGQGQVRQGADIIIGRDEETSILAKSTDVSGAQLDSQSGFVETSGDHLKTSGISIKAKDWLLDPTDINIVAAGTATPDTPSINASGTTTYQETAGINTSEVLKSTIESAINGGTNVTITTANPTVGANGAGNITLGTALNFTNTGSSDATLTLLARNGITQNAGASITTDSVNSTKLVNVVMTAEGKYMGFDVVDANSKGIILNSTINTNGQVTIDGTMKTASGAGVYFGNGSGITASKITVTGDNRTALNNNVFNGIVFNGVNTFVSSGADTSTFLGKSSSQNNVGAGIMGNDGATLRFTGKFSLDGQNTNVGYRGVRFGAVAENLQLFTSGDVTFQESTETTQVLLRGTLNVQSGAVTFQGGSHVDIYNSGTSIIAANGTTVNLQSKYVMLGESGGVNINTNGALNAGYTLNIKANRLDVRVVAGQESTINVGTGTTNISTYTAGKEILIGSDDVTAGTTKLGLTNAELNRISGQSLAIGDTVTSGNITVAGATTTNAATGNIAIQTAGNIAVSNTLTVGGAGATKTLTMNAAGATSAVTQAAAIKSNGLELLGTNASFTLTNAGNDIKKIAGNTKLVSLTNNSVFAVDTVNTVGLTTSGNTTFSSTASVTENQKLDTAGLELLGVGGSYTLTDTGNNVRKIAGTTGTVNLVNNNAFTVDTVNTVGLTTTGNTTFSSTAAVAGNQKLDTAGLELLGVGGSYSLTSSANNIRKIAGNTGTVSLTNNSAFAVDTVNTVGLTTSGNTTFRSTAAVSENQKLDTAGLELLGVGGNYTLTNTSNNIRKIAGSTGSVSLTNNSAFAIDTVNTVGLTTTGNTRFSSTAAVTQTQKVAAAGLELVGVNGSYTLTNAANTVTTLAANTGSLSFVDNSNLSVGTVNTSGITTTAADLTLVSNSGVNVAANINTNNHNISITANGNSGSSVGFQQSAGTINAGTADITIVGITKTDTGWPTRIGADVRSVITGNNISITGTSDTALATDGMGVQFEGASSVTATGTLSVSGEVKGGGTGRAVVIGNGINTPTILSGATGIEITGTLSSTSAGSPDNAGVFIEASGVTATSSGGAITITGNAAAAGSTYSKNAVFLKYAMNLAAQNGTTIQGASVGTGASIYLDPAANINVTNGALAIQTLGNNASNASIMSGANAIITQNTNAGVLITTEGQGNITAPKIVNNGTGNVVVAAGKAIASNIGSGGQVLTLTGNSITQNSTGKTYIYSGQASSTGVLSNLSNSFSTLYYEGVSNAVNAGFSTSYDGSPANDLTAPAGGSVSTGPQVFFRSATKPSFTLALDDLNKQYGDLDPTVFVATGGVTTLTNAYAGNGGNNNFAVAVADVIASLTGTRTAGENVGAYAYSLDGSALNTTLSTQPNLNIVKRDITLTSITAANKEYDGSATATINDGVFANTFNGETLSLSGTGVFADPNFGTGKLVTVADVTTLSKVDGTGHWSNYNLTTTGAKTTTADIAKKNVILSSITAANKFYDGSNSAVIAAGTIATGVGTETLLISGAGTFSDQNAADGKTVTVSDVTALTKTNGTGNWSNYNLTTTGSKTTTANISKKDVTLDSIVAANKTYDGTDAAIITSGSITTGVGLETLLISGSGTFDTKNFGSSKTVTVADVTALTKTNGTGHWSNYNLTTTGSKTTTADIAKASLTVTATQVTKEYDSLTGATGFGSVSALAGAAAGEMVNSSGGQVFTNPNAGAGNKTVQASGVTIKDALNGDVTGNYNINYVNNTTSTITPAALTIKVNDSAVIVTQDASQAPDMGFTFLGLQGSDSAATVLSGGPLTSADRTYTDPAGTAVANHPTAGSYANRFGLAFAPTASNNNYTITVQNGNLLVAPADKLLITVASANDTYGNRTQTNAALAGTVSAHYCLTAVAPCTGANYASLTTTQLANNQWKASDTTGSFVVFDTVLTTAAYSQAGYLKAGSYSYDTTQIDPLSLPNNNFNGRLTNGGTLTIDRLTLNPSGSSTSKVYDGSTGVSGVTLTPSGAVNGDDVSMTSNFGSFASKDVGSNIAVTMSGLNLTGLDAANYSLSANSLNTTGSITPKQLTLIGTTVANKVYNGNAIATVTSAGTLSGLIGNETLTLTDVTGTFSTASVGSNLAVSLRANLQDGVNGGLANNYSFGPSTAYANITQTNIPVPRPPLIPAAPNRSGDGGSASNPFIVAPRVQSNADICTPANLEHCTCEKLDDEDDFSICYIPAKTASIRIKKKTRAG